MSSASTDDSPLLKLVKDMRANLRDLPVILRAWDLRLALLAVCAVSLIGVVVVAFVQRVVKREPSPVQPAIAAADPRPAKPSPPEVGTSDKPRKIEPPGGGASTGGVDPARPEPAATPRHAGAPVAPRKPAVEAIPPVDHAYMIEAGGVRIELAVAAQGVQEGWIGLAGGRKVERSTAAPQLRLEVSSIVLSNAYGGASCGSLLNAAVEFRVVSVSATADNSNAPRKLEDTDGVCLSEYSDLAEARKDARRRALQKAIRHAIAER